MSYLEFIKIFQAYFFLKPLFDNKQITYECWNKGEIVISFNQKLDHIYFFTSGRGRAYRSLNNGKEVIYSRYGCCDIAGDLEFITDSSTTCNIISSSKLCGFKLAKSSITQDMYLDLFKLFSKEVANKFKLNSMHNSIKLGYNLDERVAHYCLYEYKDDVYSMDELSGILGTTYRHLSRVLKKFSDNGYIKVENRQITLLNRDPLKRLSELIKDDFLII